MAEVLLVEDDPDIRTLMETWLQWMGHEVVSAASADQAVALVNGSGALPAPVIDVAILDIVMPDHSGLELLHYLRLVPATVHLPAIVLSASKEGTDREAARKLRAHFIAKPVSRSVLQAAVEAALASHT